MAESKKTSSKKEIPIISKSESKIKRTADKKDQRKTKKEEKYEKPPVKKQKLETISKPTSHGKPIAKEARPPAPAPAPVALPTKKSEDKKDKIKPVVHTYRPSCWACFDKKMTNVFPEPDLVRMKEYACESCDIALKRILRKRAEQKKKRALKRQSEK